MDGAGDTWTKSAVPEWTPRRLFDADEFHRMGEAGIFHEDDPYELIEGEIIQMAAIRAPHAGAVMALTRLLSREAGDSFAVSVQNPLRLGRRNEPEPDVVLLRPRADRYRSAPAIGEDAALVIEVSDSSLAYDTEVKLPLYARHGITELRIVDITTGEIQVCRKPADGGYAQVKRYGAGQFVTPLSLASAKFAVDDVLGPPA